jgi:hypothetical protein
MSARETGPMEAFKRVRVFEAGTRGRTRCIDSLGLVERPFAHAGSHSPRPYPSVGST